MRGCLPASRVRASLGPAPRRDGSAQTRPSKARPLRAQATPAFGRIHFAIVEASSRAAPRLRCDFRAQPRDAPLSSARTSRSQTRAHSPRGVGPPLLLVTVACAMSALALSSCTPSPGRSPERVDFRGDTARVRTLAWADPLATLEARGLRNIVLMSRVKGTIVRARSVGERIVLHENAVAWGRPPHRARARSARTAPFTS